MILSDNPNLSFNVPLGDFANESLHVESERHRQLKGHKLPSHSHQVGQRVLKISYSNYSVSPPESGQTAGQRPPIVNTDALCRIEAAVRLFQTCDKPTEWQW